MESGYYFIKKQVLGFGCWLLTTTVFSIFAVSAGICPLYAKMPMAEPPIGHRSGPFGGKEDQTFCPFDCNEWQVEYSDAENMGRIIVVKLSP